MGRHRHVRLLLALAATVAAAMSAPPPRYPVFTAGGCSAWPGDTIHHYRGPPPPTAEPTAEAEPAELLAADPGAFADGPPDLTGNWAQMQVTATLSEAPLLGEIRATTTTLFHLALTQDGTALSGSAAVCDVDVQSEGLQTLIPDSFVAAIGESPRTGRVEPSASGYTFHLDRHVQVLGAALENVTEDQLPTEPDDARVADQDGDGHPGMTIRLDGMVSGEIYIVQRVARALEGAVINVDRIDGYIDWHIEQITLEASSFMLESDTRPRPDPTPERNVFRTVRVDPSWGCAEIGAQRDVIFP